MSANPESVSGDTRPRETALEVLKGLHSTACKMRHIIAKDALEVAMAALAASPAPGTGTCGEWQPIETAPKDEDCVLLYQHGGGVQPGYWERSVKSWLVVETRELTGGFAEPTHWMPLPGFSPRTEGR
jgi:hypothetical protein